MGLIFKYSSLFIKDHIINLYLKHCQNISSTSFLLCRHTYTYFRYNSAIIGSVCWRRRFGIDNINGNKPEQPE